MAHTTSHTPYDFQSQATALALKFIQAAAARFLVFSPRRNLNLAFYSPPGKAVMEQEYHSQHWRKDPMHPTHYEGTDVRIISNSMLKPLAEWKRSEIYLEFLAPHGYTHDMDVFFRQGGEIVGVLTLLRSNESHPFTQEDTAAMEKIYSFIEYTLNKVFLPEQTLERQQLSAKYQLTPRELDVIECALSGLSNKKLLRRLRIELPTLRTHLQHIYNKISVHSGSEMIAKIVRENAYYPNAEQACGSALSPGKAPE